MSMIQARIKAVITLVLALAALLAPPAVAASPRLKHPASTFLAAQIDLDEPQTGYDISIGIRELRDQTIRQTARLSAGGGALKLRLSNEFGIEPLTIDAVTLAHSLGLGRIVTDSLRSVTFHGKRSVTIAPGAEVLSDAIAIEARALSTIAVSMHIGQAKVRTGHRFSRTTTYIGAGDQTASAAITEARSIRSGLFMPEIIALRKSPARVIVAFGDSITDSSPIIDAHQDWPDHLAGFVNATHPEYSVVNAGIGGNRWVRSNMGPCGTCRFERDVLRIAGVTHVVLALGINDIGLSIPFSRGFKDPSQAVNAQQIIAAMQDAIRRAKAHGIKVYVATLVPFQTASPGYYTTGKPDQVPYGATTPIDGEQIRAEVNAFIRQNREIDGVIDFDRAIADPADPLRQRKDYTQEGLHPNAAGLTLFAGLVHQAIFGTENR